jgi:hypothetical protein
MTVRSRLLPLAALLLTVGTWGVHGPTPFVLAESWLGAGPWPPPPRPGT